MFEKTMNLRGKPVAFMPDLIQEDGTMRGGTIHVYNISAYWHEISGSKHLTAFGSVYISIPEERAPVDYSQLLTLARQDVLGGYQVAFDSGHKIGGTKPWHSRSMFEAVYDTPARLNESDYSVEDMQQMHDDLGWVPPGCDGWYRLR